MLCMYCGKSFEKEELTPMYEENKPWVNHYCARCLPDVMYNVRKQHDWKSYKFGTKGE